MPIRATFGNFKSSRGPNAIGLPSTDTRVKQYVNEAIQRLITMGDWVGTVQKYRFCASNGCIVLPRQIEQVLAVAVCKYPITIRSEFFEFVEHGYGLREETDGHATQWLDHGTTCTFNDISGVDKKIKVYSDVTEAVGTQILIQGYDDDGNWIRTQVAGVWYDGEFVTPTTIGTLTTNIFTSITGVQKPITNGNIRLYQYSTTLLTQTAIAEYEPDEINPVYRKALIAGLSQVGACADSNQTGTCTNKTITVLAKMAFLPVNKDNDWLLIPNLSALKMACMAIKKEEANQWEEAAVYMNGGTVNGHVVSGAIPILQAELSNYTGDATVMTIRTPSNCIWGGGGMNLIAR